MNRKRSSCNAVPQLAVQVMVAVFRPRHKLLRSNRRLLSILLKNTRGISLKVCGDGSPQCQNFTDIVMRSRWPARTPRLGLRVSLQPSALHTLPCACAAPRLPGTLPTCGNMWHCQCRRIRCRCLSIPDCCTNLQRSAAVCSGLCAEPSSLNSPGHVLLCLIAQLGLAALQDPLQIKQILRLPDHLHIASAHHVTLLCLSGDP